MTTTTVLQTNYLSADQIADALTISKRQLWRWIEWGQFPPPDLRLSRKLVRWDQRTLNAWLASRGVEMGQQQDQQGEPLALVDSREAALLLGVSWRTFHRMYGRPGFPKPYVVGKGGRAYRWRRADLLAWLNGHSEGGEAGEADGLPADLISRREAALVLGASEGDVERLVEAGRLTAWPGEGSEGYRVRSADVAALVEMEVRAAG